MDQLDQRDPMVFRDILGRLVQLDPMVFKEIQGPLVKLDLMEFKETPVQQDHKDRKDHLEILD
jgi:hypothetical protein